MIANDDVGAVLDGYAQPRREHLIPILQEVQDRQGYLSQEAMIRIGERLHLPASKVYGVATFYNQFRFQPKGRVHCTVCRGTACHVKGSLALLETIKRMLKIDAGQTTRDGAFSLEVVACMGACGLAPLVTLNEEFHAAVSVDSIQRIIRKQLKASEADARAK
ncbi:MAG TPA: NADH-quinone oxidoreductase subunit NuoE [Phycisphaerae bacterium]|nr:NADH-quinone oxidoreductase subunit NuoE [Phycisphaerales bacterium]HRX87436.1 NADH-quinone oxidoreductase subunit NuoE [Phycisphaerae bacterium]